MSRIYITDFEIFIENTDWVKDTAELKPNTQQLGESLIIKIGRKEHAVTNVREVYNLVACSATAIKNVLPLLERADNGLDDHEETVIRVTWSKSTRRYPSEPCMKLVKIICFNSSPKFATTIDGDQVSRTTLYRMPKKSRIAEIFAKRNEVRV